MMDDDTEVLDALPAEPEPVTEPTDGIVEPDHYGHPADRYDHWADENPGPAPGSLAVVLTRAK
jgi:hypothetical protein